MDKIGKFIVNAFAHGITLMLAVLAFVAFVGVVFFMLLWMPALVGDYVTQITGSVGIGATVWIALSLFMIGASYRIAENTRDL